MTDTIPTSDGAANSTGTMRTEPSPDALEKLKARLAAADPQPSAVKEVAKVPRGVRKLGAVRVEDLSEDVLSEHLRPDKKSPDPLYAYRIGKRILMVPMWTGMLLKDRDGIVLPDIVMVSCADQINDGGGIDMAMRKKGFKHVEDIPDDFAPLRDKCIEQRQLLIEREKREHAQKVDLVKLGLMRRKAAEIPKSHAAVHALDLRPRA